MAVTDPDAAPSRTDLPFLRHRARPRAVPAPALPATSPAPAVPLAAPAPRAASSSLDLGETVLQIPGQPARRAPSRPAAQARTGRRSQDARVCAGGRMILGAAHPTVTLTRLQSGIGTLVFELLAPADAGPLRLGAAYELADGRSSTVQTASGGIPGGEGTGGERFAPPRSRRPLLVGTREQQHERILVDLRQSTGLRRLVLYAFSGDRAPLAWSGTLLVTALGGARVEVPLESLQDGRIAVLASLYNVAGELVLRAELQPVDGDVREAARAYGYDAITWFDDRTPLD